MKEYLEEEKVTDYAYWKSKDNVAAILTKTKTETQEFRNIFLNGLFSKGIKNKMVKLLKITQGNKIRMIENNIKTINIIWNERR